MNSFISIIQYRMKGWVLCLLLFVSCSGDKNEPDWNLVWSDEFNYTGLPDVTNWGNEVGFIRNNELQYYANQRPENAIVMNGNLLIIARKESYESADYTSASLITYGKRSWTYGKIEARIKLTNGQGLWPAFWTLGQNIYQVGWPECGEIDIMEHINNVDLIFGTLHWLNGEHISSGGSSSCNVNIFHNYGVEWDKESIKWFLDGEKYYEVTIKDNINSTEEFHLPHYIIMNMAIGGAWPGPPDVTTSFPDTMFVDYVRVFQKTSN
jgi:beta-glucanase (GH16 family)